LENDIDLDGHFRNRNKSLFQEIKYMVYNRYNDLYIRELSWSWSYGSWIYNYLCNQ